MHHDKVHFSIPLDDQRSETPSNSTYMVLEGKSCGEEGRSEMGGRLKGTGQQDTK